MSSSTDTLRVVFGQMSLEEKKEFIEKFKLKIQDNNLPGYEDFLNECIKEYGSEASLVSLPDQDSPTDQVLAVTDDYVVEKEVKNIAAPKNTPQERPSNIKKVLVAFCAVFAVFGVGIGVYAFMSRNFNPNLPPQQATANIEGGGNVFTPSTALNSNEDYSMADPLDDIEDLVVIYALGVDEDVEDSNAPIEAPAIATPLGVWITLEEALNTPGVYIKDGDRFILLGGQALSTRYASLYQSGHLFNQPQSSTNASVLLDVLTSIPRIPNDTQLILIEHTEIFINGTLYEGYTIAPNVIIGEHFVDVNNERYEFINGGYPNEYSDRILGRGNNSVLRSDPFERFTFGRFIGTQIDEISFLADRRFFHYIRDQNVIDIEIVRTLNGYFEINFITPPVGYHVVRSTHFPPPMLRPFNLIIEFYDPIHEADQIFLHNIQHTDFTGGTERNALFYINGSVSDVVGNTFTDGIVIRSTATRPHGLFGYESGPIDGNPVGAYSIVDYPLNQQFSTLIGRVVLPTDFDTLGLTASQNANIGDNSGVGVLFYSDDGRVLHSINNVTRTMPIGFSIDVRGVDVLRIKLVNITGSYVPAAGILRLHHYTAFTDLALEPLDEHSIIEYNFNITEPIIPEPITTPVQSPPPQPTPTPMQRYPSPHLSPEDLLGDIRLPGMP